MVNVQKHKLFLSLLLLTMTGIFSACTDDTEHFGTHHGIPLDIQVGVNTESRAVITGNSLPDGSQIGVTVVDKTGSGYQSQDYNNVCYQAMTEDGSQVWKVQSRSDILLSGEAGTLYAYYPWTAAATDITQIAVDMDEEDQKDWMVAQPITNLSDAQATAAVKMQHMLTNFKLAFYKGDYSGKGVVTDVTIRSNAFATTGTLDAMTAAFTGYGDTHTLTRDFATTLGTDKAAAAPCHVMVVPNTVNAPVTVSVTVDGNTYSSTIAARTLLKGKSYNYTMKLTSTGLNVTEVSISDWQTRDLGETEFVPSNSSQSLPNGVYAVRKGDEYLILPENISSEDEYIAVALIVNDTPVPQRFMIEKYESNNAAWYDRFIVWDANSTEANPSNTSLPDKTLMCTEVGDWAFDYSSASLPMANGSYPPYSGEPFLQNKYDSWTSGTALGDFNGKTNTDVIKTLDSSNRNIGYVLNAFNADNSQNQGYSDWYMPSLGQLALIYKYHEEIENVLTAIGGRVFDTSGNYWSSTEYDALNAWYISFNYGAVSYAMNKISGLSVRVIRDIVNIAGTDYKPGEPGAGEGGDYTDWLQLTYNVTDAAQPVNIFSIQEDGGTKIFDIADVTDMVVLEGGSRAAAEPQVVTPVYQYTFSSAGEHTVYVKFEDMTRVPDYAFTECTALVGLKLPGTIEEIGAAAFGCTNLTEVNLNEGLQTLNQLAFALCPNLTRVYIPASLHIVNVPHADVFQGSAVAEVVLEQGLQTIPARLFAGCTALTEITIPESVKMIDSSAFEGCTGLTSIDIPNSVANIEQYAFQGCTGLTEFTFPDEIRTLSSGTLKGCTGLTEVTIPKWMSSIGSHTFEGCTSLSKITSYAWIEPSIGADCFKDVATGGVLFIRQGRTGSYASWANSLSTYNWTVQEMTE